MEDILRRLCEAWREYEHNPWGGDKRLEELFKEARQLLGN